MFTMSNADTGGTGGSSSVKIDLTNYGLMRILEEQEEVALLKLT